MIAREVAHNGGREKYRPVMAERRAAEAGRRCRPRRLGEPGPVQERVIAELKKGRSPVAIRADLRLGAEGVEYTPCVENHLPGRLHRGVGGEGLRVSPDPTSTTPGPPDPSRQPSTRVTQHRQPARRGERPQPGGIIRLWGSMSSRSKRSASV